MPNRVEPTKEQIQWLLEQCGLRMSIKYPGTFYPPNKTYRRKLPSIDSLEFIGFLLKYVVPKLIVYLMGHKTYDRISATEYLFNRWMKEYVEAGCVDFTLALFWAIYKALGGK